MDFLAEGERLLISFSGGKSSAYMSQRIKRELGHADLRFVFSNTGQENEETLEFVHRCDVEYGLNVVWVEAVVNPQHGKGIRHKVVDFASAARDGEPFEAFIAKSGIPNRNKPQCSDRLKALVIESYKREIGWRGCKHAIGIRDDESRRRAGKSVEVYNLVYPMLDWWPTDKEDVNLFWEDQPFTLELEEHEGNCKTCWKKSNKKLWLLALEHPERFEFFDRMEKTYQDVKPNSDGTPRVFFRGNRSAAELLEEAKQYDAHTLRMMIGAAHADENEDGCTESCEAYTDATVGVEGELDG